MIVLKLRMQGVKQLMCVCAMQEQVDQCIAMARQHIEAVWKQYVCYHNINLLHNVPYFFAC